MAPGQAPQPPFCLRPTLKSVRCADIQFIDDPSVQPGGQREAELLALFQGKSVQFNAPLAPDDSFLNIVPRSHLRGSRPEEIEAAAAGEAADMPGNHRIIASSLVSRALCCRPRI